MEKLMQLSAEKKRSRLIIKRGRENIALLLSEIVFFYTEQKIVYVIERSGKKYMVDRNLAELENELDKQFFFRANRQYIININFIKGFKPYEKVKLIVDISIPDINHCIIISQETAPAFRRWMYDA